MEPPSTVGGQKLQFCMCQSFKKHMAQSLKRRLSSHNTSLHVQTPPLPQFPQVPQVGVLLQGARPLWKPEHQSTHGQPLKIICNFWVFGEIHMAFVCLCTDTGGNKLEFGPITFRNRFPLAPEDPSQMALACRLQALCSGVIFMLFRHSLSCSTWKPNQKHLASAEVAPVAPIAPKPLPVFFSVACAAFSSWDLLRRQSWTVDKTEISEI